MRRLPIVLVGACVAASIARVAAAWSELPAVMASHFNGAGRPDAFMPRDSFFTSLGVAFAMTTLIPALCPLLLRHVPVGAINVPHRDYWFAPERRAESVSRLERTLAWLPVPVAALFTLVVELTIEANLQHRALDISAVWIGLALLASGYAFLIGRLYRQFPTPPMAPHAS